MGGHAHRGAGRAAARHLRRVRRGRDRRGGAAHQPLQDRGLHHRAPAAPGRGPGRRLPELVAAYREFGTDIGIAFQLRDDLLGVFGDPAVTGKPSGDDLREGKRTVLIAEALQRADADAPAVADLVRSSLGTDVTPDRVAELRTAITELGAVDAVEKRIAALTDQALTALDASTATPEAKRQLRAMALAATARSY